MQANRGDVILDALKLTYIEPLCEDLAPFRCWSWPPRLLPGAVI